MERETMWIIGGIVIVAAIIGIIIWNLNSGEETIKIGVIAPLSGKVAFWGESMVNPILLAADEWGGKVEVIVEDSKGSPQEGVTAMNKLVNADNVNAVVGDIVSSVTLAIAPVAERNKIILITESQDSQIKRAGDYIFRISLSNDLAGEALAERAYTEGKRRVAILYVLNDFGKDNEEQFKKAFEALGGEVIASEGYALDERDFGMVSKIKSSNPDALVMFINLEGPTLGKKLKEIGFNVSMYGGSTWNSKPNTAGVEGIFEGLIYPVNKIEPSEAYQEFMAKYKSKYGKAPSVPWMAANAYDAFNILVETIEKEGNNEKVKNALYNTEYRGVNGKIDFDSNGDAFNKLQIMVMRNGTGKPLG